MKQNGLGKLYDRLTPEERFRLDVEATARGDEEESRRLADTCPRRSYEMNDIGFAGRWDGVRELSMVALLDLGQHVAKLRVVDAFRSVLPLSRNLFYNEAATAYMRGHQAGSRYAGQPENGGGEAVEEEFEDFDPAADKDLEELEGRIEEADILPRLLDRLERDLATEALAVWRAYQSFCEEEVGLEAEMVLKAIFPPALENIKWLEDIATRLELEPESKDAEEYRIALAEGWRRFARL